MSQTAIAPQLETTALTPYTYPLTLDTLTDGAGGCLHTICGMYRKQHALNSL
jgi:hypothetical protein